MKIVKQQCITKIDNQNIIFDKRLAKLNAISDNQLSKAALWHKYQYIGGQIFDKRAVLR